MSQLFTSGDQNTEALASGSVLPKSIQGLFPLRLTGLISLLSKGLSGVFSSTTAQRHQFFGTHPSLRSNSDNSTWLLGRPAVIIRTFVGRVMSRLFDTLHRLVMGSYISVITLNDKGLNAPTRHRLAGQMKTCACINLYLTNHSTQLQIVCNYLVFLS